MNNINNRRDRNIDVLRMICMISILLGHYVGKGGIVTTSLGGPQILSLLFWGGGKLGVNCFVLISGFFAGSLSNNGKKICDIYLQTLFYSLGSLALYFVLGENINLRVLKCSFLPISTSVYWFASNYILLCFLKPYINQSIIALKDNELRRLVGILLVAFSVIPTMVYNELPYFSDIGWFVCLYVFGHYIRIQEKNNRKSKPALYIVQFIISWTAIWCLDIVLKMCTDIEPNYFSYMFRLPMLIASVSLFRFFRSVNLKRLEFATRLSPYIFGVYLFHDSLFFRNYFWKHIQAEKFYDSYFS